MRITHYDYDDIDGYDCTNIDNDDIQYIDYDDKDRNNYNIKNNFSILNIFNCEKDKKMFSKLKTFHNNKSVKYKINKYQQYKLI